MSQRLIGVFVLTLLHLTACRTTSSDLSDNGLTTLPPVLIVSGGFSSCGWIDQSQLAGGAGNFWGNPGNMDMAKELDSIRREYSNHHSTTAPQFVVSCYNGKSSSYIYYFSSKNSKLRYTQWNQLSPLIAEIDTFEDTHQAYFVGHSYGGWLAMQLATATKVKNKNSLLTIDPISPNHCAQASFAQSVLSGGNLAGCTSFPIDIDQVMTRKLKDKYGAWHHFFQTAYNPLHSNVVDNTGAHGDSDVKSSGAGFVVPYASGGVLGGVHAQIDTDPVVWNKLRDLLGMSQPSARAVGPQAAGAMIDRDAITDELEPDVNAALLPNDDLTQESEQIPKGSPRAVSEGQEEAAPNDDPNQTIGRL